MAEPPERSGRVEALLGGPVGRCLVAEVVGLRFVDLLDALDLPYPPNIGGFTSESSPRRVRRRNPRTVFGRRVVVDPLHRRRRAATRAASVHHEALASVQPEHVRNVVRQALHDPTVRPRHDVGDPMAMLQALRNVVWDYGFWGNERDFDRLLRAAADELRATAGDVAASPATEWWWDDVGRDDQRFAAAAPDGERGPPRGDEIIGQVEEAATKLRTEESDARRRFRSASDVPRNASGHWWSIPTPGFWTSRAVSSVLSSVPPLHLVCAEEGVAGRVVVWSVGIEPAARVFEVRAPADWARLVAMAPVDVTMSRLADWRTWTEQAGPFYLPDWRVVAEQCDGVHVTVGGYLATRSVAVPVGDGHSVLAGWDPDATLWLRDVVHRVERVAEWEGPFRFD